MSPKSGVPSWQRAQTNESHSASPPDADAPVEKQAESAPAVHAEPQPETSSLLDQARKFLEDPNIRNAPRDRKIVFLQGKGVEAEHIEELLGATEVESSSDLDKEGERLWGKVSLQSSLMANLRLTCTNITQSSLQPATQAPPAATKSRDIAPIVTYPEFLTQPTGTPPLITTRRLINTAYISGGLVATMYGVARYIVAPMTQNLAESRRDYATHTAGKLEELNGRLKDVVSADPADKVKPSVFDVVDDVSEADSDPTELFHRDYGTQTTPSLSRRPSISSSANAEKTVISGHEDRLKIMISHLKELQANQGNFKSSSDALRKEASELTNYLVDLDYQNQYYPGQGGFFGGSYLPKPKDGKDDYVDQITAFKSDIRAVKGVLLSARNFPAGGPRTAGVGA
jgi:hypothetical protein